MSYIYGWVKNIVYYFIFMTIVSNVLPHHKYEKYIKLFSGLILILIVIQPITKGLNLEEQLAYYFDSITFQNEINDFDKELLGIEQQRVQQMISQYEQAIVMDLEKMVLDCGLFPKVTQAFIEKDQSKEAFGTVIAINMIVSVKQQEQSGILAVDPILIGIPGEAPVDRQQEYQEEQTALNGLRRKVESYYGLEGSKVEIQLENE